MAMINHRNQQAGEHELTIFPPLNDHLSSRLGSSWSRRTGDDSSFYAPSEQPRQADELEAVSSLVQQQPLFSVFPNWQKLVSIYTVSFVAMISPLSGTLYYPALPVLAAHFHVSEGVMQLTITVYQIFQGIAPSFVANWSDSYGRKPAYMLCFLIFISANIGLALQDSFAALTVLRCLQSSGSSITVPLAAGTVADISTRAERGKFISYASLGVTLGPAFGPIIGGLLIQYLAWRAVFWFLVIFTGILAPVYFVFVPESARTVVDDGSIPPPRIWMTPLQHIQRKRTISHTDFAAARAALKAKRQPYNPLAALWLLGEKEGGVTLGFGALIYGGYFMVLTTLPSVLEAKFHFDPILVGVCYLPIFVGSIFSRAFAGKFLDRNFKRHAKKAGVEIHKGRQDELDKMPIERARLEVSIPMVYACALSVVVYGWVVQKTHSLAGIEVMLFFVGLFGNGGLSGLNTLVVDTHQDSPATALAANNLFRCLVSAACVAFVTPLIKAIGFGWTGVLIAGVWVVFSPLLWLVLLHGAKWREEEERKKARTSKEKDEKGPDVNR